MKKNILKKSFAVLIFVFLLSAQSVYAEGDSTLPVITINGESSISITKGDIYVDSGAVAIDDIDGDITLNVVIVNSVDSIIPGVYTVSYNVSDSSNNAAIEVTRIVTVVDIPTPPIFLSINAEVDVSSTCEVTDTDGEIHPYTASSKESYLGICALDALLDSDFISSVGLSNQYPEMGLFVTSFNDTEADSSSQYWALYQNGNYAISGISTLPIVANDVLVFKLSDFLGVETEDYVSITVRSLIVEEEEESGNSGGSSGGGSQIEEEFSLEKAVQFLSDNQSDDGSFGGDLYTDWVAVGIAQSGNESLKNIIIDYLKNNEFQSSVVTDNERHAMALMSLGINPYNGTDSDYILKIISSYDGAQIGEEDLINDDIFGLIVLSHAGYKKNDEIIGMVVSHIISNQDSSGSWGSIDMTGAAIQALYNFKSLSGVKSSIEKGELYLKNNQDADGGFGNSFSTSWAIQALSLNSSYVEDVDRAINYLKDKQQSDGGLDINSDTQSRVWSTSYAIPASLKLSWNDILESFDKEENDISFQNEEKEEIIVVLDIPTIDPSIEREEIEILEKPIKIIKPKKEIVINNYSDVNKEQILNNNLLLSANAIGAVENKEVDLSFVSKFLDIIMVPFVWIWKLWIVFGF